MNKEELDKVLKLHKLWLSNNLKGRRANLQGANLCKANLYEANLRVANLCEANLYEANLRVADLREADLQGANLQWANLQRANLQGANLCEADLRGANLQGANLRGTDLRGADLRRANLQRASLCEANLRRANLYKANLQWANLQGANLYEANLCEANLQVANLYKANLRVANLREADLQGADLPYYKICPSEGEFIAYKKVCSTIVKLLIPKEAKRISSLIGRKCRAEFIKVLEIENNIPYIMSNSSRYNGIDTEYRIGKYVYPDKFCDDIRIECSHGIHFFISREEAENFE